MIHVVAILTAKTGKRSELLKVFNANVPAVLAEHGCIEYSAVVDVAGADPAFGPNTFLAIEKWESRDALAAHAEAPHMAAFKENIVDLVESVKVHVLEPATGPSATGLDA